MRKIKIAKRKQHPASNVRMMNEEGLEMLDIKIRFNVFP